MIFAGESMKRNYTVEVIQVILALAVIILTVVLFIKSDELTILFPIVFGLAALMCFIYAVEGIFFNKNRMVKKGRGILFAVLGICLALVTYLSGRVVLR